MKVVILTRAVYPFHGYGGMERYYHYLARYLFREGIEIEVVTSCDSSRRRCIECEGISYTFLPPNFNKKLLMSIWYQLFDKSVCKYLNTKNFNIVHGTGGLYRYTMLNNRKPIIFQPFGLETIKSEKLLVKSLNKLFSYQLHKIFDKAEAVASLGEANTKDIINLFKVPKEKIFHLPNGIDLNDIEKSLEDTKLTREEFNLQDADIVLINVNRLSPNKGVPYLIKALELLNKELNTKLILVGSGPEESRIKKLIRKYRLQEKVLHFKNISDEFMFQLYTLADISVTPTLYEGGCPPLVVLEAMACGKPVVTTNILNMREAIKDGVNGFLVPPKDPKAIADAVLKIYDKNLFMKMGKASKEVVKKYDWSKIAKMAIKKYEELIGK